VDKIVASHARAVGSARVDWPSGGRFGITGLPDFRFFDVAILGGANGHESPEVNVLRAGGLVRSLQRATTRKAMKFPIGGHNTAYLAVLIAAIDERNVAFRNGGDVFSGANLCWMFNAGPRASATQLRRRLSRKGEEEEEGDDSSGRNGGNIHVHICCD